MNLKNKKVAVTGASFIGYHLIRLLLKENVGHIRVINLSAKHKKHITALSSGIEFYSRDLRDLGLARKSTKGVDVVFHLAADHGGRGYVDLKQGNTASNFLLDGAVFKSCLDNGVGKVFFASSGCVYPNYLQTDSSKHLYLKESDVKTPYDADNTYGWAKLMGELVLRQYYKDFGLPSAVGRFFTVYGPHASESHAVMATIAKAYVRQNPFAVWGDGTQVRNWTYVEDIARGIIEAVTTIKDATPVNLGTQERVRVREMVNLVLKYFDYRPQIRYLTTMPTGPVNRVADITLAKKLLGWSPEFTFTKGVEKTIEWYVNSKKKGYIKNHLDRLLMHD